MKICGGQPRRQGMSATRHGMLTPRAIVAIAALAPALALVPVAAQAPPAATDLRFDVASVKPIPQTVDEYFANPVGNVSAAFRILTFPGGRLTATFVTLRALILRAYDIKDYQLEGGPAWISTARFEIDAKAVGEPSAQEFNAMLKALLVERFALRTRTEVRQLPHYVLTLARSDGTLGPSLKPTSAACLAELEERKRNPGQRSAPNPLPPAGPIEEMREFALRPRCGVSSTGSSGGSSFISMGGMPLTALFSRISSELNAPVVDKTGLTGLYDILLKYEPVRPFTGLAASPAGRDFPSPPLKSAVPQQLGLRLEEVKAPLDVIIIESVDQPSPN
jgi:uncharacterized protein (TIGR03435 family)